MSFKQKVKEALDLGTESGKREKLPGSYPSDTDLSQGSSSAQAAAMPGTNPFPNPGAAPGVMMPSTTTARHGAEAPLSSDAQLKESQHNKLHKSNDPRGYTEPHQQTQTSGPYILTNLPEPDLSHKHEHTHHLLHHNKDRTDENTTHHSPTTTQKREDPVLAHRHKDSAVDVGPVHTGDKRDTSSSKPLTGGNSSDTPYWGDMKPGESQRGNDHHSTSGAGTATTGLAAGAGAGLALRHAAGDKDDHARTSDPVNPASNQAYSGGVYNTVTGHGSSEDPSSKFYHGGGDKHREFPLSQRAQHTTVLAATESTPGYDPHNTTAGQKYDSNPTNTGYDPSSTAPKIANDPRTNIATDRLDRDAPSSSHDFGKKAGAAGVGAGAALAATEAARRHNENKKDDKLTGTPPHGYDDQRALPHGAAGASTSTGQPTQHVRSMLDPTTTSTTSTSTGTTTTTGVTGTSGTGSKGDGYQHLGSGTPSGVATGSSTNQSGSHDTARAAAAGAGASGLGYAASSAANRDHRTADPTQTSAFSSESHPSAAVRSDASGTLPAKPHGTTVTTTTSGRDTDPSFRSDKDHSRTAAAAGAGGLTGAGIGYYAGQMRDRMHGDHTNDPSQRTTGASTMTTSGTTGSGVAPPLNLGNQPSTGPTPDINQRSTATSQPGHDSSRAAGLGAAGAGAGLGAAAAHHHNKDHPTDPSQRTTTTTTTSKAPGSDPYNHLGTGTSSGVNQTSNTTSHTGNDDKARNFGLGAAGAGAGAAGLGAAAAAHHKRDHVEDPSQRSTGASGTGHSATAGTSSGDKDDGYNHLASGTPSGVHIAPRHTSSSQHQSTTDRISSTTASATGLSAAPQTGTGTDLSGTKDRSHAVPAAGAAAGAALGAGAAHHYSSRDKQDRSLDPTTAAAPSSSLGDQARTRQLGSSDPYNQTQTSTTSTTTTTVPPASKNYVQDSSRDHDSNKEFKSVAAPAAAAAAMRGSGTDSTGAPSKVTHTCTSCGAENDITSKVKEAFSSFSSK